MSSNLQRLDAVRRRDQVVQLRMQLVEHRRIGVAQLEQRLGAARNDAVLPGSSVMRPVVHTVRAPQISGKRLSIALSSLISARPASRRRAIEVVPAWFCSPSHGDARTARSPRSP